MAIRKSICISITPELDRFVAAKVASGRYQSASEVFRAGLRLLEREEDVSNQKNPVVLRRERRAEPGQG